METIKLSNNKRIMKNTILLYGRMIFMMAIKEAHGQLEMLQKLMGMFGDNDAMEKLAKCSTYEEFIDIVKTAGLLD